MIMEAAREMLNDQDLSMHLWVEAARTAVYVQNRTPHRLLENKTLEEVFSKFKEFKALIENHTEKKIKTFQSDNGREFTSNEFKELCKESGIKRELSTPYNPQ